MKKTTKIIKANDCDCVALTYDGEVVDYAKYDQDINEWVEQGEGYDWFCVDYED